VPGLEAQPDQAEPDRAEGVHRPSGRTLGELEWRHKVAADLRPEVRVADRVIDRIIDSPYRPPARHFACDQGITGDILESRRASESFVPIPRPRKQRQLALPTEWTRNRRPGHVQDAGA
jgi:hypothetical protein